MRRFTQVDVFTDRLGLGNPLAVVIDADGLTDAEMALFANWTNLSETTFLLPPTQPGADYRVRIFTPGTEYPFAGHPTLGSCHAWLEAGGAPADPELIVQECGVGLVPIRRSTAGYAFATPDLLRSGPVDDATRSATIDKLGVRPNQVLDMEWIDNGPGWLGVLLDTPETLRALRPTLRAGDDIGVAAITGHDDPALEVRAFFDAAGTREDPVTGSLNGSLAQWLLGSGRLSAPYVASQGRQIERDGVVVIDQDDDGIWVGGQVVTGVAGHVHL